MTNMENATILKSIRELFSVSYAPECIVALSKAIELFERIPDEHGDLIDRDALGLSVQSSSIAEHGRIMHERIIGENRIAMAVLNAPAIIAAERREK